MIEQAGLFTNEFNSAYVDPLNDNIKKLNKLITAYNSAPQANKAEALLQVRQQLIKTDANFGSVESTMAIAMKILDYGKFYKKVSSQIQQELLTLGCPGISSEQINQWDIATCTSHASIPSATLFEQETQPGFISKKLGGQTSTVIRQATRLLQEINPKTIKDNTQENYYRLTNLKQSIRALLTETVATADQTKLTNLIAKINGRLADIVENNPLLKSKVYPPEQAELAQQIANLSYEQALAMTQSLKGTEDFDPVKFHQDFDPIIPKLADCTIRFLGGANAKNYLITNQETGVQQVLKIIPGLGNSKKTYDRLKNTAVKEGITDVFASHQGLKGDEDQYVYSLELTEFCPRGDVRSHGMKVQEKMNLIKKVIAGEEELILEEQAALAKLHLECASEDPAVILARLKETHLLNAVNIYGQMTDILLKFQANNAFFPDLKPTNFLVNEFEQVVIADTKTFVDTVDGMVDEREIGKTGLVQYTKGFRSPQFEGVAPFSADKEHAYLMGLSLYCYVTGTNTTDIPQTAAQHPAFLDFTKEVFQTEKGQQFKNLIEGLTNADSDQRLSMEQAKQALHAIAHEVKVEKSPFKSKPEAYFFALHNLMEIKKTTDTPDVAKAIQDMKILIENHEQDPLAVSNILNTLAGKIENADQQKLLKNIATAIQNNEYQQTAQEKYENPLARRLESEMQIALLKSPTTAMMHSVGHMSNALLNVIAQIEQQEGGSDFLHDSFVARLTSGAEQTGFGSQPEAITLQRVKEILQGNDPQDLNQILFMQFLFAQKVMRLPFFEITAPNPNMPSGKLLEVIKEYKGGEYKDNPQAFFENWDAEKAGFIADKKMYECDLFKADPTRGRQGALAKEFSSQMGVMLLGQNQEGIDVDRSHWTPDAKYQGVNLDSPFTRDLIENDAVYSAGPSGMTSLFMGIMESYGNFPTVQEKQNYFAAVSAYMVSGGLHSLHEVVGPAQFALDLIPGYQVSAPDEHFKAAPPNFHQFYQQQMDLDPEFQTRYDQGWENVMTAYARQAAEFVHAPISDVSFVQQKVVDSSKKSPENYPFADKTENQIKEILNKKPELKAVTIDDQLTSTKVNRNKGNKDLHIQHALLKINIYALKGDEVRLQSAVNSLMKTVCETRGFNLKGYSTSTTSATKLINKVCEDEKLQKLFGIGGNTPDEIQKEIKARMEACCKNEAIPAANFSVRPDM